MDVFAHLLTWNGEKYLPELFASLDAQTLRPVLRIVDNGSTDGTITFLQDRAPHALVARNVRNLGFASGHNQLFTFSFDHLGNAHPEDVYILILNQDLILDRRIVEELAHALKSDRTLGAVQPKICRAFPSTDELFDGTCSDVLDTTGLIFSPSLQSHDRGAGEIDRGQYDAKTEVMGACGALVMYRASALQDVMGEGEVFDTDFFAYREDADLALRLLHAGWKTRYVPTAKAWHYRGMFGAEARTWRERLRDRRQRNGHLAALSTRNQFLLLLKNLTVSDAMRSLPSLLFHEGGRLFYALCFEPETRKLLFHSVPLFFRAIKKRRRIMASTSHR